MSGRLIKVAALMALVAGLAGCRSSQPLAPKLEVDGVLSSIGTYCGEATEIEAFGSHPARTRRLDSAALVEAHHLIRIMRSDPSATYLGQSMRRVVHTASSETSECRLATTSSALARSLVPAPRR